MKGMEGGREGRERVSKNLINESTPPKVNPKNS